MEFLLYGATFRGTALLKFFLKTTQDYIHLFSFAASTTREMFDEFFNT